MAQENNKGNNKKRDRIGVILYLTYILVLILSFVVIGKIIYIQYSWTPSEKIIKYFLPNAVADEISPKRGAIIGRDGEILAMSTPMYELRIDCTIRKDEFKKKGEKSASAADSLERQWQAKAKAFCGGLSKETGADSISLYKTIIDGRKKEWQGCRYLKLGDNIDRGTILRLRELPLMKEGRFKSGIIEIEKDTRKYPYGTLARRTIGYVKNNSDSNGNNHIGLEGKYDYVLHGQEGKIWLRTIDNKEKVQNYDSSYVKPVDGLDVRTTLDITIQDIMDKAIRRQMAANPKIADGCGVLMDVKTGAIRAMVNLTKNPKDSSLNEVYNMAIGFGAEPGSVFKATTLMTVLEDGHIRSLDDVIPKNNGEIPGYPRDRHVNGQGEMSILDGFKVSSNYVFRYLAVNHYADNPKRFLDKLYLYKLGQAFDFDLEGLKKPYLPSPDSKLWSATDLGSTAIGYAIQETPLHILTFYNAIANKGKMMKPYLVESIEKDGVVKTKKGPGVLNSSICSKATADTLLRAMKAVTSEGTATRLKGAKLQVAGKTGTSLQVLTKEDIDRYGKEDAYSTKDGSHHHLATFVGFFPADNPKYSAIICMNSSLIKGDLYGGVAPAAAMREIVDAIYSLEPEWGGWLDPTGKVPEMEFRGDASAQSGTKNPPVPDIKGLGLKDAIFLIENSGLRCSYSGTGHVVSQNPKAGSKVAAGTTITFTLK